MRSCVEQEPWPLCVYINSGPLQPIQPDFSTQAVVKPSRGSPNSRARGQAVRGQPASLFVLLSRHGPRSVLKGQTQGHLLPGANYMQSCQPVMRFESWRPHAQGWLLMNSLGTPPPSHTHSSKCPTPPLLCTLLTPPVQ